MSVSLLTQKICNHALPQAKRYDMRDTLVCGLFLRVEVSGRKTWYVNYRTPAPEKRSKNLKLGPFEMPLSQARQAARVFIAKLYLEREDPAISLGYSKYSGMTLAKLINEYEPWVNTHMKSGKTTIRLLRLFKEFMDKPIKSITAKEISKWQIEKTGTIRGATINRRVAALQSLLGWAVKQQYLPETQFRVSKVPQNDSKTVIRYLSPEERARLMSALEEREEKNGRDYLKPAVVLSLMDYRQLPISDGTGAPLYAGVILSSNSVGEGSLSLKFFIYRSVCRNGMAISSMGGTLFRQHHIGEKMTDSKIAVFNRAFMDIDRLTDMAITLVKENSGRHLKDYEFEMYLEKARREMKLSEKSMDKLKVLVGNGGTYEPTKWGFINGITELAQDFTLDTRYEMENWAGELFTGKAA